MKHPLVKYLEKTGTTYAGLGALLDKPVHGPAVWKWARRGVPAERVLDLERTTGIPRHELRPDLYPLEDVAQ